MRHEAPRLLLEFFASYQLVNYCGVRSLGRRLSDKDGQLKMTRGVSRGVNKTWNNTWIAIFL